MDEIFDTIVIGGGLAGLSLAVQLAKAGHRVAVIERNKYPFHRVCGEYISMESWNFLERNGVPLQRMHLPLINELEVSALSGKLITQRLQPGGFGISRFLLDATLANVARSNGALILEQCKAEDVFLRGNLFEVSTSEGTLKSRVIVGAFGKRSNMDKKLERVSVQNLHSQANNWVGVKYHIKVTLPSHTIQLHNFNGGYCGISKIEEDKYCLCYLTKANSLRMHNGNIRIMEEKLLSQNPFLAKIFADRSNFLFDIPETISQINFENKLPVEKNILMAGDAAGLIAPLCGNGMSMAMRASTICFAVIEKFLEGKISRSEMETQYSTLWRKEFAIRLRAGRILQPILVNSRLSNPTIALLKRFPFVVTQIVKATHGNSF